MDNNNPVNSAEQNGGQTQPKFQISKLPALPIIGGLFLIIIIIVGIWYVFNATKTSQVNTLAVEGQALYQKGNYDAAQAKYNQALKIDPNNAGILSQMTQAISAEGNQAGTEQKSLSEATPYIEHGLKVAPSDMDVLLTSAYAYESAGQYDKALTYYSQALKVDPTSPNANFGYGHVLSFLGKEADAQKYYDKAYQLDPKNAQVNMMRGNDFFSKNQLQQSFQSYKTAANEPGLDAGTRAEALASAAIVLTNIDNFKYISQATAIAKQALSANPNSSSALATYGFDISLAGHTDEAITYIQKGISANPRISKNYNSLGLVYRGKKDFPNAISAFQKAIEKTPDDNTLFTQEQRDAAAGLYTYELARTYNQAGENADYVTLLTQAATLNPTLKPLIKNSIAAGNFPQATGNTALNNLLNS